MGRNVEIKARIADWNVAHATAQRLSGSEPSVIPQLDTFFRAPAGRLKLRELSPTSGELILYHRPDTASAKMSEYTIARTEDPRALVEILSAALGRVGEVRKTRYLYIAGQTRIHLDDVAGLGHFLELEVVLEPGQDVRHGVEVAATFQREFGIADAALIEQAYIDLLAGY